MNSPYYEKKSQIEKKNAAIPAIANLDGTLSVEGWAKL